MAAYFCYRSPYDSLLGRHLQPLPDETVLAWFQRNWTCAGHSEYEDDWHSRSSDWLQSELGCDPYGLSSIFSAVRSNKLRCPRSEKQLFTLLRKHLYVEYDRETGILCQPGAIQVYTDDDNLDVCYYFWDDQYLARHADRAAFVGLGGWRLPTASGAGTYTAPVPLATVPTGRDRPGGVYLVTTQEAGKCDLQSLQDNPPRFLPGLRQPELPDFLRERRPAPEWGKELSLLWAELPEPGQLSDDDLWDGLNAITIYSSLVFDLVGEIGERSRAEAHKWMYEHRGQMYKYEKRKPNSALGRVATSPHFAQLCWIIANSPQWARGRNVYNQWYLFDDCWASANRALADGLLRFATRWDVLTCD
jgi:hypothetical protein